MSRRPRRPAPNSTPPTPTGAERLQKVLAAAGIGSRRECEELMAAGRVEVDGRTITELGTRVDPLQQEIRVDGVALPRPKRVYYALNKPAGVVCTNRDPSGRLLAVDMVRSDERLFTVGRLDRTSEGLILITNDGTLANRLTHPRYEVEKRYLVRVVGSPHPELLTKLRRGIHLAEGVARVSDVRFRRRSAKFTDMEIALREGRNREIRRILARVGHKVVRLKRIAIGTLKLGELPVGESRPLTRDEVRQLQQPPRPHRPPADERREPKSGKSRAPAARQGTTRQGATRQGATRQGATRQGTAPERPPKKPPRPPKPVKPTPALAEEEVEVEVTDWQMEHPTGSVLAFDDSPPSSGRRPSTKKRRP